MLVLNSSSPATQTRTGTRISAPGFESSVSAFHHNGIVGKEGIEPSRSFDHQTLNLARLPVTPHADNLERLRRFELLRTGWRPVVLPLHHSRIVRVENFEISTHVLKVRCSTSELHPHSAVDKSNGNCNHHNRVRLRIFFILFLLSAIWDSNPYAHSCFGF